jgi:hypothetical protein
MQKISVKAYPARKKGVEVGEPIRLLAATMVGYLEKKSSSTEYVLVEDSVRNIPH